MKILAIVMAVELFGVASSAAEVAHRPLVVCTEQTGNATQIIYASREIARDIFAEIGVPIEWHNLGKSCPEEVRAIQITFAQNTEEGFHPNTLAYARVFEGVNIVVFYDRVAKRSASYNLQWLLAYVLVHEITHILQGVSEHAATGIMKAKWDAGDYFLIRKKALGFTEADVDLVNRGLKYRRTKEVQIQAASRKAPL